MISFGCCITVRKTQHIILGDRWCPFVPFFCDVYKDHLVKVMFARCPHCKGTFFPALWLMKNWWEDVWLGQRPIPSTRVSHDSIHHGFLPEWIITMMVPKCWFSMSILSTFTSQHSTVTRHLPSTSLYRLTIHEFFYVLHFLWHTVLYLTIGAPCS